MALDLHCHTRISDGSMGIEELIATAKRRGLSAIAVTDHDAMAGATRAVMIGKRQGIEVVPGVEFSAMDNARGQKVHILGYLCDSPDRLEGLCRKISAERRTAAAEMIRKVLRYYPIVPESITRCAAGSTTIYKQHIMHALMDAGYAPSIYGDIYDKLFSPENGCARVSRSYPDAYEIIDLIHSAGGVAVIAHPAAYHNEALLEELTEKKLIDGVEVWHPSHSEDEVRDLAAFAASHGLVATGGSDFHGMYSRTPRPLGNSQVPEDTVRLLINCKNKRRREANAQK